MVQKIPKEFANDSTGSRLCHSLNLQGVPLSFLGESWEVKKQSVEWLPVFFHLFTVFVAPKISWGATLQRTLAGKARFNHPKVKQVPWRDGEGMVEMGFTWIQTDTKWFPGKKNMRFQWVPKYNSTCFWVRKTGKFKIHLFSAIFWWDDFHNSIWITIGGWAHFVWNGRKWRWLPDRSDGLWPVAVAGFLSMALQKRLLPSTGSTIHHKCLHQIYQIWYTCSAVHE